MSSSFSDALSNSGKALLPDTDKQKLAAWNATEQPYPRESLVHQLVAAQAAASPDALVVSDGTRALTHGMLDAYANQLAHRLRKLGVGPDVIVGLCFRRSLAMDVGALGILKAGGAYLLLDPDYPAARLGFMLDDAQVSVLVTGQCMAESLPTQKRHTVFLTLEGQLLDGQAAAAPAVDVRGSHLAYIIYTSGSTGQPKGVEITHDSLLNLVFWHRRAFGVTPADRATQLAGVGFDAAVWELWPYLTAGASIHIPDEANLEQPETLRDWLVAQGITISFVPTPMAERLLGLDWPPQVPLRLLLTGGDTLHHYPSPKLPFQLINNYGPTECTVVASSGLVSRDGRPDRLPPIGRPIANTQIYILDENLQPVGVGTPGELCIGGAGLARGYRNRPDLTAERFVPDPFNPGTRLYRTGDLARYLPDGQIAFLGRIDDQIKIRGYRIEPNEIVSVLNEHPAVVQSAVVARELAPGDKRLVAYVVLAPGSVPTHSALRSFLAEHLPEHMVPALFVRLAALPTNAHGKLDREALPSPSEDTTLRDDTHVAPRTEVETRVARILTPLLGLEQVSVEDNFFALGGHSLLGAQLIARLRDEFSIELTLRSLFEAPTVAQLSTQVEQLLVQKLEAMTEAEAQRLLAAAPPDRTPA